MLLETSWIWTRYFCNLHVEHYVYSWKWNGDTSTMLDACKIEEQKVQKKRKTKKIKNDPN
jgi:hypothetical protein